MAIRGTRNCACRRWLMLAPVPARLTEWAYVGFAIDRAGERLTAHRPRTSHAERSLK